MRTIKHALILLALTGICLGSAPNAHAQDRTAQIKAVFLFKFSDYITWPPALNPQPGQSFTLCIWGDHPFGDTLDLIAKKQTAHDYNIRYYRLSEIPQNCQLVFSESTARNMENIRGPFLISDHSGFANEGGMMQMTERGGKIKLTINLKAAENAGYKVSARLLDISDVIR